MRSSNPAWMRRLPALWPPSTPRSPAATCRPAAAASFDGAQAILALVASQALFVTGRQPAPPMRDLAAGIRSVFPPVESPHGRDLGAQAGRLADVFRAGPVTGRLDFP